MTSQQITSFLVVCQCMSFTDAAVALNLTQSAVSRQMSTLEEELGIRIFDRKNNALRLTGAGRKLQAGFERLARQMDQIVSEARKLDQGVEGELRLGLLADQSLDDVMGAALKHLTADRNVDIVVTRHDFKGLYEGLLNGSIDVANTLIHSMDYYPECAKLVYAHDPFFLAVKKEYAEGLIPPLSQADLDAFTKRVPIKVPALDSYMESQQSELEEFFQRVSSFNSYKDFSSILPLTCIGMCACLVNRTHVLSLNTEIELLELREEIGAAPVDKGLLWIPDNPNPVIPLFVEILKDMAAS